MAEKTMRRRTLSFLRRLPASRVRDFGSVEPSGSVLARIQRFEVLDLLGTGAMGAVYRARDPQLGREVAIKVLARPSAQASRLLSMHGRSICGAARRRASS